MSSRRAQRSCFVWRRGGRGARCRADGSTAERLSEDELVILIWHLVLTGHVPTHLIANSIETLLGWSDQLAALRADVGLMPQAVEEPTRWCGLHLLTLPRYATADVTFGGVSIHKGSR